MTRVHRWGRSALALVVACLLALAWLAPLEGPAHEQADAGLQRALVSFATARALNAIISLAQGTEVALHPAGFGINLSIGETLDPVNDLVEQFAELMLMASVAFGVQKVLLAIGAHWIVTLLLSAIALAWLLCQIGARRSPSWLSRMLVVLLMARFAVPVVTIGGDLAFQHFLASDYQTSQQAIEATSGEASESPPAVQAPAPDRNLFERLKEWMAESGNVGARVDDLQKAAEQATEHIVRLMVIFILQTLVIPLLLLWAMYMLARGLADTRGSPGNRRPASLQPATNQGDAA
ncbi:MAG TPA: hypothetical protein PK177_06745 [Burkholderiaceae bacterium]|nr:hypothetical protein [Burkholderiaceae bacterium]